MARFLRPDIDFSDDDDSIDSERRTTAGPRIISNQIKKTQTNINAIKNPDMYSTEEEDGKVTEEDEPEVVISDDESPRKSPRKTQKRKSENSGRTKRKKPKRVENSDDEFLPTDEDSGSNDDEEDNESVASEDLSEDNISDSDFNPDSEEEIDADKEDVLFDESHHASEATINLSSDGESPDKKEATKTFDPNSTEFWDKVQELRSKGFSIQQAGNEETAKNAASARAKNVPVSPARTPQNRQHMSRLSAFSNLVINFDHDKRCARKCFLMDPKQKATLTEVQSPNLLTPEFVKGCIKIVNCNARLGEVEAAREAITITSNLGNIPGVSALCQAMISGVKAQMNSISQFVDREKEGMTALKAKEFTKALESLDAALALAAGCLRLKMARGDCLAHLGRYVEGAKAASSILQQDQRNVGALFLRGFCLYHKNNIERALSHFQQVLQINKDHERAKTLLNKTKQLKEKRDAATKANVEKRFEDAEKIYTEALGIDPRNKRAEVYFNTQQFKESVEDCEASMKLDQHCLAAMLVRAKCHIEAKEWDQAVRIMERMNSRDRHNQQGKVKAGEAAQRSGHHQEAHRLFSEAVDVDKHNQKYRHLLREAKQQLLMETRVNFYEVLGIEKTVGESEIRKAYFKKSKEYHPDKHANDSDEVKEEFSKKFKLAKEAYEVLSDNDKRKMYDSGRVKAPPGGWYQDVEKHVRDFVQMRGGFRGRGPIRGVMRGGQLRGNVVIRQPLVRGGPVRPVLVRGPVRGQPIRVGAVRGAPRPMVRPVVRAGMRPMLRPGQVRPGLNGNMRPGMVRPRGPILARGAVRGGPNGIRPNANGQPRPRLNGISITPLGRGAAAAPRQQPDVVSVDSGASSSSGSLPSFGNTFQ